MKTTFANIISLIISVILVTSNIMVFSEEIPPVTMLDLDYTRDVFISDISELVGAREKYGTNSGFNTGLKEDFTSTMLPGYSNGVLNYDNASYKFGPLGSKGNPSDAPNAIHAFDGNPIVIDLKDGFYSSIRFIANSTSSSHANAKVTISYLGEMNPQDTGITRIASFRTEASPLISGEHKVGRTGALRLGNPDPGSYSGYLYGYYITPDPNKIVTEIQIDCSYAVVFAVTTIGVGSHVLGNNIETFISSLPSVDDIHLLYRSKILALRNIINEAAHQGIHEDTIVGIDKFRALEEKIQFLVESENEIKLHVKPFPIGDDNHVGTFENPLASLEGARKAVRSIGKEKTVRVIFHEGDYAFDQGVYFDAEDSGTEEAPVIYEAAENERVVFKGSRKLNYEQFKPVEDPFILERLPVESRSKVKVLDLREQGVNEIVPFVPHMQNEGLNGEYVSFYINGKEQPISQWPNGDGNYAVWSKVISPGSSETKPNTGTGGVIEYTEDRPSGWLEAKDLYFGGYPGYDYRYERLAIKSIDPDKKTITMAHGSMHGFVNDASKRWKVFNLLEEIDTPGEWYIDRDTMQMYYYPMDDLPVHTFEMAWLRDDLIHIENAHDIKFVGIEFSQTCGNAIVLQNSVQRITIENCTFSYIGTKGVYITGSVRGQIENNSYNIINGGRNCIIRNNKFQYIGSSAVDIIGGNRDTLDRGENVVNNNYIYNASRLARNRPNVEVKGVGNYVEHNVIHNSPFHAINFNGNNHSIRYNELYNVSREVYDAAVIYSGRNLIMRGSEVAYNYVHDYLRKDEKLGYDVVGVFLDDRMSGVNVHHNIFVNGSTAVQIGGGQDNIVAHNIMLNMQGRVLNTDNRGETWQVDWNLEEALQRAVNPPFGALYNSAYPRLPDSNADPRPPHRNVITNNVSNKSLQIHNRLAELGTVQNNILVSQLSDFINPEEQDYRVRSGSDIHIQLPDILTETFDLNQIGMTILEKPNAKNSSFHLIYPRNGEGNINPSECRFSWEEALHADKYRLVIATDPNMENIIFDRESDYNYMAVGDLPTNHTKYYWKVYAINISRAINSTWECSGQPYIFYISSPIVHSGYTLKEYSDGTAAVEMKLNNRYTQSQEYTLIAVVKDHSGSVVSVTIMKDTLEGNARDYVAELILPEDLPVNGKIECFVWNDDSLMPLMSSKIVIHY